MDEDATGEQTGQPSHRHRPHMQSRASDCRCTCGEPWPCPHATTSDIDDARALRRSPSVASDQTPKPIPLDDEHRELLAEEKVTQRLLAGTRNLKANQEIIAADWAFRASKELVRAHTDTCGQYDPELLTDLDVAALRWAGVDPANHSTWVVHRGNCPEAGR